jgi:universal stress protein E
VPAEAFALLGRNPKALKKVERQARQSAKRHFDRALRTSRIPPARRYLIAQHPINGIIQATQKTGSAILVMGAVSRTGFKRLLIGNTAERILDEVSCDILVVKPAQFRNRVPVVMRGPQVRPEPVPGYY